MTDEKSSSSVKSNKTWLWTRERKFKAENEGCQRFLPFRDIFPIWELMPMERWCPANLTDFPDLDVLSLYRHHCISMSICCCLCLFSLSPPPAKFTIKRANNAPFFCLNMSMISGPRLRCFELCGASVTWIRALSLQFLLQSCWENKRSWHTCSFDEKKLFWHDSPLRVTLPWIC